MQNFSLLSEVGRSNRPVLLKRGIAASIERMKLGANLISSDRSRPALAPRSHSACSPFDHDPLAERSYTTPSTATYAGLPSLPSKRANSAKVRVWGIKHS